MDGRMCQLDLGLKLGSLLQNIINIIVIITIIAIIVIIVIIFIIVRNRNRGV